jgi:hypothetical protein
MEISQIRFSLQELSIALVYENCLAATVVFPAVSLKSLIQGVPIKTKPSNNHILRYKITSKAGSRLCNNSPLQSCLLQSVWRAWYRVFQLKRNPATITFHGTKSHRKQVHACVITLPTYPWQSGQLHSPLMPLAQKLFTCERFAFSNIPSKSSAAIRKTFSSAHLDKGVTNRTTHRQVTTYRGTGNVYVYSKCLTSGVKLFGNS